jgi:hypothetical protein
MPTLEQRFATNTQPKIETKSSPTRLPDWQPKPKWHRSVRAMEVLDDAVSGAKNPR